MMKRLWSTGGKVLPLGVLLTFASPAMANTIQLKVFPVNGPFIGCPETVTAYETPQPYREGSYARDGMVQLSKIATNIKLFRVDPFSVTWVGQLKPQFQNCQATASMWVVNEKNYSGQFSYLRLRFLDGKAYAILDMTGLPDANSYTSEVIYKGMRDGNPRWTWGGTD